MKNLFVFAIAAMLMAAPGCKHHEKTVAAVPQPPPLPAADTTKLRAATSATVPLYRESNPRSSDILHMKLEVNFDWTNARMNGRATLRVKPYFYPTSMLYLNARGMEIRNVEVNEVAKVTEMPAQGKHQRQAPATTEIWHKLTGSSYVYENDSLKIKLGKTFPESEYYYVVIDYVAKPNELKDAGGSAAITEDKGLYFINPKGENAFRMPQIWTQGETQANSVWFPTIDSPNERMTQEILMTVDEKFTTLSNGYLFASSKQAGGTRLDHWKLDEPHAPYLAMMAVGEFKKVTGEPWNGKEISYYVEREYEPYAKVIFGDTREMIDFYSKRLGVDFAWPKYAQIAVREYVSGAMENTSATLHGDFMVYQTEREAIDGKRGEPVIAHELFHQWFGDLVTCESWSNLPLNESFATYGEYLWYEYKHGREAADHHHVQSRQGYLRSPYEKDLIRFHYEKQEDMFDGFSYSKGGQVLHMLRKAVGDDAFFASLKNYLETNRFKPVEIHNLRLAFEETTGRDMNWFFNQWFLNKGRPKLKVTSAYNADKKAVELVVEQKQDLASAPLYRLPLEIDIYSNGKADRRHIEITRQKDTFQLAVSAAPQLVNFDAERQLLCDLSYRKTREEYMFQYRNTPLYEDRLEALKALEGKLDDPEVFILFREAALGDHSQELRAQAMESIQHAPAEKLREIKDVLLQVYDRDTYSRNKAAALAALNTKFMNDADVIDLTTRALENPSYKIASEALRGLAKRDPAAALTGAKRFETENGRDIIFAVAQLYGDHGGDQQIFYFHKALRYMNGFDVLTFLAAYSKAARRCTLSTNAISAAQDFESVAKGANRYTRFTANKAVKDLVSTWEGRESAARTALESAKQSGKPTGEAERQLKEATDTKEILAQTANRIK